MVDIFNSINRSEEYNGTSDWISELPVEFHYKRINEFIIPGSFESGSYELINNSRNVNLNNPDDIWKYQITSNDQYKPMENRNPFPFIYSTTQNLNIFNQLNSGIRFLHLQIGYNRETCDFHLMNFYFGPSISDFFTQVLEFLKAHRREIILIDVKYIKITNQRQKEEISSLFLSYFYSYLYHYDREIPRVIDFWKSGKQLMVFWPFGKFQQFWPRSVFHIPKIELNYIHFQELKKNYNPRKISVFHFVEDDYHTISRISVNPIFGWCNSVHAKIWCNLSYAKANRNHELYKANIITFAFAGEQFQGNNLVKQLIDLNFVKENEDNEAN